MLPRDDHFAVSTLCRQVPLPRGNAIRHPAGSWERQGRVPPGLLSSTRCQRRQLQQVKLPLSSGYICLSSPNGSQSFFFPLHYLFQLLFFAQQLANLCALFFIYPYPLYSYPSPFHFRLLDSQYSNTTQDEASCRHRRHNLGRADPG